MEDDIRMVHLERPEKGYSVTKFGYENAKKVCSFHKSFPEYKETPLVELKNLAKHFGVSDIYIKDESFRFGLNAFKVLGGSYALGNYIAKKLNKSIEEMGYDQLISKKVHEKIGEMTFITATDGNHGRGVAWTANRIGQKSVVYMPKGSAKERLDNILALGSNASITDLNYDDAVRKAYHDSQENGWVMVQDTAWEGYEDIPTWIMQGYTTMAYEVVEQLKKNNARMPTHIFLQAGVGAMSGGIAGFFADLLENTKEQPIITIVEPHLANCIFQTAEANDGKLHMVTGEMNTIMAGLACGEPCTIGWNVLHDHADYFVSMPDYVAAKGMRVLGNPLNDDHRVISGESGAATMGFVAEVLSNDKLRDIKTQLKLDENSRILCFSTEGDTDKDNYRQIVWDGKYSSK